MNNVGMTVEPGQARGWGRPGDDQATVMRRSIDLFNRQGYDCTSMGDIAKELGIVKSAIYHHVPSKEHLLSAALDEALDGLTAAVDNATDHRHDHSAYERLHDVIEQSVEILANHLPAITLLLRVRGNSEVEQRALMRRKELDDKLAALVAEAVKEGSVRSDISADLASRLLFGMVNSLIEWYRPEGRVDAQTIAQAVVSMAFDGLRRPS